jgi:hypothetical protein
VTPATASNARLVHLRCGSDIRDKLAAAGIAGDFVEFADPVCQGPVPGHLDEAELRRVRARFIADAYAPGTYDAALARLEAEAAALNALDGYERIVLWFEHDIYDQTVVIRLLAALRDRPALHNRLFLIAIDSFPGLDRFIGLGQLTPTQLRTLWGSERPVTPAQMDTAARAWAAYTADDPLAVWAVVESNTPDLPFLAPALRRHLQELPWTGDGLSLTERLSLQAVAEGADTPSAVFRRLQHELEPLPFLGDLLHRAILHRLAAAPDPALTPFSVRDDPIALTAFGCRLLVGDADWVAVNGIDKWVGGMCLDGAAVRWRWDGKAERPVRG